MNVTENHIGLVREANAAYVDGMWVPAYALALPDNHPVVTARRTVAAAAAREAGRTPGTLWYRTYEGGRVVFGYTCDRPGDRPEHGGDWSSNPERVAGEFGIVATALRHGGYAAHILLDAAKALLPAGFEYRRVAQGCGMGTSAYLVQTGHVDGTLVCWQERHRTPVVLEACQRPDFRCPRCGAWGWLEFEA